MQSVAETYKELLAGGINMQSVAETYKELLAGGINMQSVVETYKELLAGGMYVFVLIFMLPGWPKQKEV